MCMSGVSLFLSIHVFKDLQKNVEITTVYVTNDQEEARGGCKTKVFRQP